MRVIQFYDGKNFYANLRNYQEQNGVNLSLHYDSLAKWLVEKVGGSAKTSHGVHYYTAVAPGSNDEGLKKFLNILSRKEGFFIHKFETIDKQRSCPHCNTIISYQTEKGVDTMMVADMLSMMDGVDVVILLSGDADLVPAVEILQTKGKKVYIASWDEYDVSKKLRNVAFGYINLPDGISEFASTEEGKDNYSSDFTDVELENIFVEALTDAQEHFGDQGYVGINYFLKEWRDERLPRTIEGRRLLLDKLVDKNEVEVYDTGDASKALKVVEPTEGSLTL